jgi:hypothetical protein
MILHSQKANLHSQIANSEPLIQTLLNTHVPLWVQQHMVDRHYSLNFKPWSARTLYVYAQADLAQQYFVAPGCQKRDRHSAMPTYQPPRSTNLNSVKVRIFFGADSC